MSDASPAASLHLVANVVLLALMTLLHLAGIGSVAVNLVMFFQKPSTRPLLEDPERIGNMIAYVLCGLWAVSGVIAAPVTAVGLAARAGWARGLGRVYWGLSLLTVCCLPVGAYGLWSLSRDDVRRALSAR